MHAVYYERTGPAAEVLIVGEVETPRPDAGEVLVEIAVSGVSPHDTKGRSGWTGRPMPHPRIIPHSDGAGRIVAVGDGVDTARIGERVWIHRADHRPGMGAAAAYAVVPSDCAAPLPDDVPFAIGAGFGVPALTAHAAVFAGGPVEGLDVLVQGGAGAVSAYAIQFARHAGARVFATVSSAEKAAHARRYGADVIIDYTRDDVAARVLAETGGRGIARIVEVDFGANLAMDVAMIAPHGFIAAYSSSRVREPVFPYYDFAPKDVTIRTVQGKTLPDATRQAGVALLAQLMKGGLQHPPTITFPFRHTAAAHAALESGGTIGKIVVEGPPAS
jgi:NADPH:quinone reductase